MEIDLDHVVYMEEAGLEGSFGTGEIPQFRRTIAITLLLNEALYPAEICSGTPFVDEAGSPALTDRSRLCRPKESG